MKGNKVWVLLLIVGLVTVGTLFYMTMIHNANTSYANGRFVMREGSGNEAGYYLYQVGTK